MVSGKSKFRLFRDTRRGTQASLRNNAAAYGYTIVVTCAFAMLQSRTPERGLLEVYLFIAGSVFAFGLMEAVASNWFREQLEGEPSDVVALGSTFSIVSISASVGVAAGLGRLLSGHLVWVLSPFATTVIYLLLVGLELAVAQRIQEMRDGGSNPD